MVNENKTYSTKETAEILGIKERAVQTRCKIIFERKIIST